MKQWQFSYEFIKARLETVLTDRRSNWQNLGMSFVVERKCKGSTFAVWKLWREICSCCWSVEATFFFATFKAEGRGVFDNQASL